MNRLTKVEFHTCQVILNAAHDGISFDDMCIEMRDLGIPEYFWRPYYDKLGIKVRLDGENRYVYAPGNLVAFPIPDARAEAYRHWGVA